LCDTINQKVTYPITWFVVLMTFEVKTLMWYNCCQKAGMILQNLDIQTRKHIKNFRKLSQKAVIAPKS